MLNTLKRAAKAFIKYATTKPQLVGVVFLRVPNKIFTPEQFEKLKHEHAYTFIWIGDLPKIGDKIEHNEGVGVVVSFPDSPPPGFTYRQLKVLHTVIGHAIG